MAEEIKVMSEGGYRYSLDPFLLAGFCSVTRYEAVADLGAGSGILPLLLWHLFRPKVIHAIEIQRPLYDEAESTISRHGLSGQINLLGGDVREVAELLPSQSCQVVVTNPPYRLPGKGRLAPDSERAAARHELHGGLDDFLKATAYLLGDGGRFYVVYLAERLTDLLEGMRRHRLEPKRLRCVHGRSADVAKMVLVEGRKGGRPGLRLEAPLIVYEGEEYSPEVQAIYDRFRELWD